MPSVFEILTDLFSVPSLAPVPGTPNGPRGYDPGLTPPSTQPPPLQYPSDYGKPDPGATAGGAMGPLDPNSPGYQAGQAARQGWDNLTGALDRIGIDLHNGIAGFQEGLPIFGTFAVLAIIFVVGLVMFMAEGEKAVVREVLPISK